MTKSLTKGAMASTASAEPKTSKTQTAAGAAFDPPAGGSASREHIRHMLFGTPWAVKTTIQLLHKLGYAEPNDWSRPIATGRVSEVMAILTKRVGTD